MTCPCRNPSHDYDKLLDGAARDFIKNRRVAVWEHWSDENHKNGKSPEFMQDLKARINKIKSEATQ